MDVAVWLSGLGLGQYADAFEAAGVDGEVLPDLTADDLREIGVVAVGHRRKILSALARLNGHAEAAPPAPSPAPTVEPGGDQRHVAILFADLVGYTRLTSNLGGEATHALLHAFFSEVDALIEREGGRVDKHIGDCVMGVFGAPVAHGNDAERAVRAALAIVAAMPALSTRIGRELAVHVGVTTGVVVASRVGSGVAAEYAVTGDSVNLAARLADAARAGEILASNGLHDLLEDRLIGEDTGLLPVKGFAEPVRAWRVRGLSQRHAPAGPMVGRRAELRQFGSILTSCLSDRTGHAILLRGEAGVGKTRLGEEFERLAREAGCRVHRGLVLDFGAEAGRDALRAVMRDILGVPAAAEPGALAAAATRALAEGRVAHDLAPHLNELLGAPQPEAEAALYEAMDDTRRAEGLGETIAAVLAHATSEAPRLLLIEDLHWARPRLLRALAQLTAAIANIPAMVVLTTRLEGDPIDRTWRAATAGTPLVTMDLGTLRPEEARALCAGQISEEGLIEGLIARSGGNPLFLQQLLRHSVQSDNGSVPATIQSLVQASVDRLRPQDRRLVQAASVIGQRIDRRLLTHLVPGEDGRVSALVESNLLREQADELLFVHALIRDAIYGSLLGGARRELHGRAAEYFAGRDLRLHAEHLSLAAAPTAPAAFRAAAEEEVARYHYDIALSLIERGLADAANDGDRLALLLLEGDTRHHAGQMEPAARAFAAALDLADTPETRCRALIGLASVKRVTEDLDGALADLDLAETEARRAGLLAENARLHSLRGNLLFPRGDIAGCHRAHEAALAFAREAGRPDLEAAALGGLGDAEYMRGRMAASRAALEACVRIAHARGLGRVEVANAAQIVHAMMYDGSLDEALVQTREALAAATRVGHLRAEINARAGVVKIEAARANHEAALDAVEGLDAAIARLGAGRFRQVSQYATGMALGALGRPEEAVRLLEAALAESERGGFAFHGPCLLSALARQVDDPARARALIERAAQACTEDCVGHNQFIVYADGIDVAARLRDAALLARFTALADSYPADERLAWSVFQAERGRALLLEMEGDAAAPAALAAVNAEARRLALHAWRTSLGAI
ncbi:adenylate/guanylate cyclase domain-containing protein [Acuticoccus kandeliae]|uniref:adenylate/guanylate cyclase domain-containing protein n=1 Tax=Acuticoccus kandeliae TaxID=2073160 RepID=UPI001473DD05|nr:adenylate/guanylate cyclase domain-containing protein [Acuticoccus kandeliae]